jgi:hypothetical protein
VKEDKAPGFGVCRRAAAAVASGGSQESGGLRILVTLSTALVTLCLAACAPPGTRPRVLTQSGASPSPAPPSPVRAIDFENFSYPEIDARGQFTLKGRREPADDDPRSLADVIYGDVTGDGEEEALVVHSQSTGGSAIPYFVYVYTVRGDKPKLLWSFDAGERGDGGLRQVYAGGGDLVVELYGRDRVVDGGTSAEEDNIGVCCPKFYTRSRYEWRGGRFRLEGKEAALPNPQGGAALLKRGGIR